MDRNGQKDETQKIIDELQAHIEDQKERLAEKDATIADLRRLIDELLSLKANLEETLAEFRRQLFGTRSEKTFMGMPYYRQEGSLFQLGLNLPRETMANWYITCAERYFYPIYERMHKYLIKRDVLHADETTCQVLREKDKAPESESFMWIYLTGNDGLPPIVMYEYQPGRGGKYPKSFLEGFSGLLQCDGYQGYNSVEDVVLVCCLAHCRRKFYEALSADRKKKHKLLDISSAEAIKEPVLPAKEEWGNMIPAEGDAIRDSFTEERRQRMSETMKKVRRERYWHSTGKSKRSQQP